MSFLCYVMRFTRCDAQLDGVLSNVMRSVVANNRELFLGLVAYDLGCCHFYNEEYGRARDCFSKYFKYAARLQPTGIADICMER